MATFPCILFAADPNDPGAWNVGVMGAEGPEVWPVPAAAEAGMTQTAAAIVKALASHGYNGQGVVLALPSAWCLCAQVTTGGLRRGNRDTALLYRLEEHLPLAAEDLVADFTRRGVDGIGGDEIDSVQELADPDASPAAASQSHDGQVLGIAVLVERLKPLVSALEAGGVAVQHICPAVLLAGSAMADLPGEAKSPAPSFDAAVWGEGDGANVLAFSGNRLVGWHWLPAVPQALGLALRRLALERRSPLQVRALALEPQLIDKLNSLSDLTLIHSVGDTIQQAAVRAAALIVAGRASIPLDLRRGPLAAADPLRQFRKPLKFALAAAVVLALSLAAAMLWRTSLYQQVAVGALLAQDAAFQDALPNRSIPTDPRSRLQSERRRLRALAGDTSSLPAGPSALDLLADVLQGVRQITNPMNGLRLRLLELRLGPGRLWIDGEARTHGDAESLAQTLRHLLPLNMDPPKTQQKDDRSVIFTLTGTGNLNGSGGGPVAQQEQHAPQGGQP